ncbi:G protein alpha i subunit-like [Littorina saxatilis]|uniref:G protein alpha i subunit-like n=1 Tax=Littorina saxatilis TaxID=31220 RepID=UPI0038B69745
MGASASVAIQEQEARRRSRSIDDTIAQDRAKEAKTVKILMLGPCEAGKSTLAKQVRLIHDKGFADKEKAQYRHVVRANLANSLLHVLQAMEDTGQTFSDPTIAAVASKMTSRLDSPDSHERMMDVKSEVHMVIAHPHFHRFLESSHNVDLAESTQYFFKSADRILSSSYVPTDYDILRARQKSLGLAETVFHFKGFQIRLCDVDGSSTLKKKWLQCFENVSAVLFTAAMDTYDTKSKEDEQKTVLEGTLEAFSSVCHHPGFIHTPLVLFLNKKDTFKAKLKVSPLAAHWPEYKGTSDYTEGAQFIKGKFQQTAGAKKHFFVHVTCAIETATVRSVFDSCLASILQCTAGPASPDHPTPLSH